MNVELYIRRYKSTIYITEALTHPRLCSSQGTRTMNGTRTPSSKLFFLHHMLCSPNSYLRADHSGRKGSQQVNRRYRPDANESTKCNYAANL
jgi:hypothetical protein